MATALHRTQPLRTWPGERSDFCILLRSAGTDTAWGQPENFQPDQEPSHCAVHPSLAPLGDQCQRCGTLTAGGPPVSKFVCSAGFPPAALLSIVLRSLTNTLENSAAPQ